MSSTCSVQLQQSGKWEQASQILSGIGKALQNSGAECLLVCTNTMHKLAEQIQSAVRLPLLNIIDVTAEAVKANGHRRPPLLATQYTMEGDFYTARLRAMHDLNSIIPDESDRKDTPRSSRQNYRKKD